MFLDAVRWYGDELKILAENFDAEAKDFSMERILGGVKASQRKKPGK